MVHSGLHKRELAALDLGDPIRPFGRLGAASHHIALGFALARQGEALHREFAADHTSETKTTDNSRCAKCLILLALVDQRLVDVRDHTTTSDGGLDEGVQLLISTNGELKVTRCDTLHFEILGGVTSQLEHLCS